MKPTIQTLKAAAQTMRAAVEDARTIARGARADVAALDDREVMRTLTAPARFERKRATIVAARRVAAEKTGPARAAADAALQTAPYFERGAVLRRQRFAPPPDAVPFDDNGAFVVGSLADDARRREAAAQRDRVRERNAAFDLLDSTRRAALLAELPTLDDGELVTSARDAVERGELAALPYFSRAARERGAALKLAVQQVIDAAPVPEADNAAPVLAEIEGLLAQLDSAVASIDGPQDLAGKSAAVDALGEAGYIDARTAQRTADAERTAQTAADLLKIGSVSSATEA